MIDLHSLPAAGNRDTNRVVPRMDRRRVRVIERGPAPILPAIFQRIVINDLIGAQRQLDRNVKTARRRNPLPARLLFAGRFAISMRFVQNSVAAEVTRLKLLWFRRKWSLLSSLPQF